MGLGTAREDLGGRSGDPWFGQVCKFSPVAIGQLASGFGAALKRQHPVASALGQTSSCPRPRMPRRLLRPAGPAACSAGAYHRTLWVLPRWGSRPTRRFVERVQQRPWHWLVGRSAAAGEGRPRRSEDNYTMRRCAIAARATVWVSSRRSLTKGTEVAAESPAEASMSPQKLANSGNTPHKPDSRDHTHTHRLGDTIDCGLASVGFTWTGTMSLQRVGHADQRGRRHDGCVAGPTD